MYQVWSNFLNPGQIAMLGIVVTFLLTFLALKHPFSFLPSDHGREFAVNGGLSRGKLRGVGLVIVICFLIGSVLFLPLGAEYVIYAILLVCIMLSGYLDDASETPWSDYKKGAIDLVISIVTVITFVNYNSTTIYFGNMSLTIPKVVYIILGIILIFNVALSAATLPIFLGFWLMLSLRVYTRRILSYISWPLFFGLLAGVLDEGIQMFADGRGSDVRDVVIDFSGVVFGLLAALFLLLLVRMFHVLRESKTPL